MRKCSKKRRWPQSLSDRPDTVCITATRIYTTIIIGSTSEENSGILK
jgi:hypothetical protein